MNENQVRALVDDLSDLAALWASFRARHQNDTIKPQEPFCSGLEVCAAQLSEVVGRFRLLADWDAAKPALSERLTDA